MRGKLYKTLIPLLLAVFFVISCCANPILAIAEEVTEVSTEVSSDDYSQLFENILSNETVKNFLDTTGLSSLQFMIQAAINSGDVYSISQLQKLELLPAISADSVYIFYILNDYTPVGIGSYTMSAETSSETIESSALTLPDGYELVNTAESHTVNVVYDENGNKTFDPVVVAFTVKPILPDPLPVLKLNYVDNGTIIYTEKILLGNYDKMEITANQELLDKLGYALADECQENSFRVSLNDRIPLIPSDYLVWYRMFFVDVPIAISGNALSVEVTKVRDVDLNVNVIFQLENGDQVGDTYQLPLDPLEGSLTVDSDNLPALPVGYKLSDSSESHTAELIKVDGVWVIEPKTLAFTVVSNQIEEIPEATKTPHVLGEVATISPVNDLSVSQTISTVSPLTIDQAQIGLLFVMAFAGLTGFLIMKFKKIRAS